MKNKRIHMINRRNKRLRIVYSLMIVLLCITELSIAASKPSRERSAFEKPLLRFSFTVHNPGETVRHLVEVGVRSTVTGGNFSALAGSSALLPLADYPVWFHVRDKETRVPSKPVLKIAPKDTVNFTISLIPDATGAIGYWSARVSAIAVFDDGTILKSQEEAINANDVRSYRQRTPEDEEILAYLRHMLPSMRKKGLRSLNESSLERPVIERIITAKLSDKDQGVRFVAATVAVELRIADVVPIIVENLRELLTDDRMSESVIFGFRYYNIDPYCELLGKSQDPYAAQVLLEILVNPLYADVSEPASALIDLQHPSVPELVMASAVKHNLWASDDADNRDGECYLQLCRILIKYGEPRAGSILTFAVRNSTGLASRVMGFLSSRVPKNELVLDEFVLSMKNLIRESISHRCPYASLKALDLLLRMEPSKLDRKLITEQLCDLLDNEQHSIRIEAAEAAEKYKIKGVADKLRARLHTVVDKAHSCNNQENICSEIYFYSSALGQLGDQNAIDILFEARLLKLDCYYGGLMNQPIRSLVNLRNPRVPEKAMEIIRKRNNWASKTASYDEASCYLDLCRLLIEYRAMKSIPIISRAISQSTHDIKESSQHINICGELLAYIDSMTNDSEHIVDPFFLGLQGAIEKVLYNQDWYIRTNAVEVLLRMPLTNDVMQQILHMGKYDKDRFVRKAVNEYLKKQGKNKDGSNTRPNKANSADAKSSAAD